jgi:pimeloyl-ACP methyl ester carboxylesterase
MSSPSALVTKLPRQGANFTLAELPDDVEYQPLNFKSQDGVLSKGMVYKLRGSRPRVGAHVMHPRTDQTQNYNILPLVRAGYLVLGRTSRSPNNDVSTLHEPLVLDMAEGIRYLYDQGCEHVVLVGNSGGGTLGTFYQSQARAPLGGRLTVTASQDPFDLNAFEIPPASGVVIIGGHLGEGALMGKMLDGAVLDEDNPLLSDPSLDLFEPANGFEMPPASSHYSPEFLERYRSAQHARSRRLDAKAMALIELRREAAELAAHAQGAAALRLARRASLAWFMTIYRTTADPATLDLSIDPDDREVGTYWGKRPDLENNGPYGFARYITPEAWLSTWSPNTTAADTLKNLAAIPDPVLIVHYAGDVATRLSEVEAMRDQAATDDATLVVIREADHYGNFMNGPNEGQRSPEGTDAIVSWALERFGQ